MKPIGEVACAVKRRPPRKSKEAVCLTCNRIFIAAKAIRRFCSKKCFANFPEFKEQWRKQLIEKPIRPSVVTRPWDGKSRPDFQGEKHPLFGRRLTDQQKQKSAEEMREQWKNNQSVYRSESFKEKMRKAQKEAAKKRPNYKGGISSITIKIRGYALYKAWRTAVFRRDEYTCQKCGKRGGDLESHHIETFSSIVDRFGIAELDQALACAALWDISNGVTRCIPCHKSEHA